MAKLTEQALGGIKGPTASKRQQAEAVRAEDDNRKKIARRKGLREGDTLRHLIALLKG